MTPYGAARPKPPARVLEPLKTGRVLAARVGTPAEPHLLCALSTRYEALGKSMGLTRASVRLVETLPGGGPQALCDRLADLWERNRPSAAEPCRAGRHLAVDVTRSPEVAPLLAERLPEAVPVMLVQGVRQDWSLPYRLLGRLTLLSGMSVMLPRGVLAVDLPDRQEDPLRLDRPRLRDVLARVQVRPPRLEDEDLALGGSADDDAGLVVALASWWAAEMVPTPWKDDRG